MTTKVNSKTTLKKSLPKDLKKNLKKRSTPAKKANSLVRLKPLGFNLTSPSGFPIFLLKDDSGELTLPVRVSAIDVGIALSNAQRLEGLSPHGPSQAMMKALNLQPKRAIFTHIQNHIQYLSIEFENADYPSTKISNSSRPLSLTGVVHCPPLTVRADEAMSFCLFHEIPLFATRDFIWNSRSLAAEAEKELQALGPLVFNRNHPYLM